MSNSADEHIPHVLNCFFRRIIWSALSFEHRDCSTPLHEWTDQYFKSFHDAAQLAAVTSNLHLEHQFWHIALQFLDPEVRAVLLEADEKRLGEVAADLLMLPLAENELRWDGSMRVDPEENGEGMGYMTATAEMNEDGMRVGVESTPSLVKVLRLWKEKHGVRVWKDIRVRTFVVWSL
jgi:hypothetical protein